jgi:uncharacterized protein
MPLFLRKVSYEEGIGVKEDKAYAVELYKIASSKGNLNATYHLGICYENGYGVIKNESEALLYFQHAAKRKHQQALEHVKEIQAHLNNST